ncbi:hypothetical protein [Spirochaeta dissipatitropha]
MKKSGPLFPWLAGLVLTAAIILSACSSPFDRDRFETRRVVIEMNSFLGMQPVSGSGGRFLAPDITRVTLTLTPKGSGPIRSESGSLSYDSTSDSLSGRIVIDAVHPGQYSLRAEALDSRGKCLALCISDIEVTATGQQQISILLTPPDEELFSIPAGYEYSGGAPGGSGTITLAPGRRLVISSSQQSLANQSLFGITAQSSQQALQMQLRNNSGELVINPDITTEGSTQLVSTTASSKEAPWYLLLYNSHSSEDIVLENIKAAACRPAGSWFSSVQAVPVDNDLQITADYNGPGSPQFQLSWQNVYGEVQLSEPSVYPEFSIPGGGEETLWQIQAVIGSGARQVYHLSQEFTGILEPGEPGEPGDTMPKEHYVDEAAEPGGDGSQDAPFDSIAAAYAAAAPAGDTIRLAAGEYYIGSEGQPLLLEKSVHIRGDAMNPPLIRTIASPDFSDTVLVGSGVTVRLETIELHASSFEGERSAVRVQDGGELDVQNVTFRGSAGTGGSSSLIVMEGNSSLLLQGSELFPSFAEGVPEVYGIFARSTFIGDIQIGGSEPWQSNYFLPDASLDFQAQYVLRHVYLEGEDQGPGAAGSVMVEGNVFGDFSSDYEIGKHFRVFGAELSGDFYEDLSAVVYAEQGSAADIRINGNQFAGINMYVNGDLDELMGVFSTINIESADRLDISGNSFISKALVRDSLTSVMIGEIAQPALFHRNYMHLSGDSGYYGVTAFASSSSAYVFSNVIHSMSEIDKFQGLVVAPGSILYGNTIISDREQEDGDSPGLIVIMDEGSSSTGDVWIINNLLRTASADQSVIVDGAMYAEMDVHVRGNLMQKSPITEINEFTYTHLAGLNNVHAFSMGNRFLESDVDLQLNTGLKLQPITSGEQQVSNLIRFGGVDVLNVLPSGLLSSLPAEVQNALNTDFSGIDRSGSHSIGAYVVSEDGYVDLYSGRIAQLKFDEEMGPVPSVFISDMVYEAGSVFVEKEAELNPYRQSPFYDDTTLSLDYGHVTVDYSAVNAVSKYAMGDFTTSQSWSFWIERLYQDQFLEYGSGSILWFGDSEYGQYAWNFGYEQNWDTNQVEYILSFAEGESISIPFTDLQDMWNQFVLEWDALAKTFRLYINNTEYVLRENISLDLGGGTWENFRLGIGHVYMDYGYLSMTDIRGFNRRLTEMEREALFLDNKRPAPSLEYNQIVNNHEELIVTGWQEFADLVYVEFLTEVAETYPDRQIEIYFSEEGSEPQLIYITGEDSEVLRLSDVLGITGQGELVDPEVEKRYEWFLIMKYPGGSIEGEKMIFRFVPEGPVGT